MNFTKEQLDVLIAALEAQRAQIPQGTRWAIMDKDGDYAGGYVSEGDARRAIKARKNSDYAPYSLYRCEPVA